MRLKTQKRIAAAVMKCSPKRIKFDTTKLKEIKEGITKADIRGMIIDSFISKKREKGISNARSKYIKIQKSKGKRRGQGSRKGRKTARTPRKEEWMNRVRLQRKFLAKLKEKNAIDNNVYWEFYRKIGGGFFRSKRHLQLYLDERKLSRPAQKTGSAEDKAKAKKEQKKPADKAGEKSDSPKSDKKTGAKSAEESKSKVSKK